MTDLAHASLPRGWFDPNAAVLEDIMSLTTTREMTADCERLRAQLQVLEPYQTQTAAPVGRTYSTGEVICAIVWCIGAIALGLIGGVVAFLGFIAVGLAGLIYRLIRAAWVHLQRTPELCDCAGQVIEAVFCKTVSWLGAWLIVGIIAACSWVARQSRAVRAKAARARRKRLVRARRHMRELFHPDRLTETARLRIAASAYEASQEEYERTHELTLTLAGAGLYLATIATSRSWS